MKFSKMAVVLLIGAIACTAGTTKANAQETNFYETKKEVAPIDDIMAQIEMEHENANITIVDGVINVYIQEEENRAAKSADVPMAVSENQIYAPNGGIWFNFIRPWYTYINPDNCVMPYKVVFLPNEEASALYKTLSQPEVWDIILDSAISDYTQEVIEEIIDEIDDKFGILFKVVEIQILLTDEAANLYNELDVMSLGEAMGDSLDEKVRIDYTTLGGWPVNYYYTWSSNYVTDSPWEEWEPAFYRGVYYPTDI